jgi:Tfp pilus assembly protein PilW
MTNYKLHNTDLQEGQSLFELVVAIAVSALIVVAMVSLAATSIKNSTYSKNRALASTYAQQATEWLRGERDADYNIFISKVENIGTENEMCLNNLIWMDSPIACNGTIEGTPFERYVVFGLTSDSEVVVTADVVVSWTDSGGLHEVKNATNFSNWQ